jgi:hypothetical protein
MGGEPEATPRIARSGAGAAQMNQRREVLLLLERGISHTVATQRVRHVPVEIGGRELDRVIRQDARIERVEPA